MTVALKLADAGRTDIADIVDLDRYPIDRPGSAAFDGLIETARAHLAEDGCLVLQDFLRPEALARARDEAAALAPKTFFSHARVNAYFTADDPDLPSSDPRRHFMERTSGFLTRDQIAPDTIAQRLYVSPAMKAFVAASVSLSKVYEYADPFAGLVINVLPPGTEQPWHYDTNEFITSILTQEPEGGGVFQYAPNIRSPRHENLDAVRDVLTGADTGAVRTLTLRPGDLQLFKGRFSLHRVSRVEGRHDRHTAILAYAKAPGVVGQVERTRQLYGRVSETHLEAERRRDRTDGLVD